MAAGLCVTIAPVEKNTPTAYRLNGHGQLPAAAPEQNTDQERYHNRMQGRFLSPTSHAIKGRTWSPIPFDSDSDGPSGFLDRLSSRLNGLFSLVELVWAIDTFASHLSSPRQCGKIDARDAQSFPAP